MGIALVVPTGLFDLRVDNLSRAGRWHGMPQIRLGGLSYCTVASADRSAASPCPRVLLAVHVFWLAEDGHHRRHSDAGLCDFRGTCAKSASQPNWQCTFG